MNKITKLKMDKVFKNIPDRRLKDILVTSLSQDDRSSVVYCYLASYRTTIREYLISCTPKNYMLKYNKQDIMFSNGHRILFTNSWTGTRGIGFDNLYMFNMATTPPLHLEEFQLSIYPIVESRKHGRIIEYE